MATKPGVAKGSPWGGIFAFLVVLAVAVPQAIPVLIGIAVVGFFIWAAAKSQTKKPGRVPGRPILSSEPTSDAVTTTNPVTWSTSPSGELPFVPSRADTGEIFDFARRGMDARAVVDDVRYGADGLFEIDLKVSPRGASDYRTTIVTAVPGDRMDEVRKGRSLRMRIDPKRPGGPMLVL